MYRNQETHPINILLGQFSIQDSDLQKAYENGLNNDVLSAEHKRVADLPAASKTVEHRTARYTDKFSRRGPGHLDTGSSANGGPAMS